MSIKHLLSTLYKSLFMYISAIGLALTLLEGLEPLVKLSKFAKLLLGHWEDIIVTFWTNFFFFIKLDLSLEVYEALTASIFFLSLGVFSSPYIIELIKKVPLKEFSLWNIRLSYLFNILFLLGFSILNLTKFYETNIEVSAFLEILVWSGPFLIFSYSLFFVSVKIAIAPLLRKKISISLVILFTIILLDKMYVPLKSLLAQINN